MASSIFRVSRTETEGQQSGPATLNKAQEPVKMRVYEDESDVDLSEIGDKEIFAVEEENDLANVYVTDLVQEGNMNPITSNAVARFTGANYSTSEVKTSNTWIDGKPIYRRVFTYVNPNPTTNPNFTYGTISDFAQLVDARTITNSNNGTNQEASEYSGYRRFRVDISGNTATLRNESVYNYNVNEYILIIEYTKTTD